MEAEIEVGEYVRDIDGFIVKVNEIKPDDESDDIWLEEETLRGTWKSMVVKHSKDIIDLVEIGDYVNGELIREPIYTGNTAYGVDEGYVMFKRAFGDIKSIVTKEQFEQMKYKVEE